MQVFLDLDGPILDVSPRYYALYATLLQEEGHTPLRLADYWQSKRNQVPEADIVAQTCPTAFVPAYVQKRLRLIENPEYLALDRVWDSARPVLRRWSRQCSLSLVTLRNRREALLDQLARLEILSFFGQVYSEDDNQGDWTVKRRLLRPAVSEPAQCVLVGDTEADVEAGKALGITTVGLTCGIRTRERLAACRPDYLLDRLDEIDLDQLREVSSLRSRGAQ